MMTEKNKKRNRTPRKGIIISGLLARYPFILRRSRPLAEIVRHGPRFEKTRRISDHLNRTNPSKKIYSNNLNLNNLCIEYYTRSRSRNRIITITRPNPYCYAQWRRTTCPWDKSSFNALITHPRIVKCCIQYDFSLIYNHNDIIIQR